MCAHGRLLADLPLQAFVFREGVLVPGCALFTAAFASIPSNTVRLQRIHPRGISLVHGSPSCSASQLRAPLPPTLRDDSGSGAFATVLSSLQSVDEAFTVGAT